MEVNLLWDVLRTKNTCKYGVDMQISTPYFIN